MHTDADGEFGSYVYSLISAVLDRLDVPFLMVDRESRILFASPVVHGILDDGRHIARNGTGVLICQTDRSHATVGAFLTAMRPDEDVDVLLPSRTGDAPLFASLTTFQPPHFSGQAPVPPVAVVFIRNGHEHEGIEVARMLYALSEAETGAVRAVLAGTSLKQHAEARNVSVHTARKQLNAAMKKAGVSSQLQLQALIGDLIRAPV